MKKNLNVNLINERAIERLKRYYPYDEESRTFTIEFHFERLDQILVKKAEINENPQVDYHALLEVSDKLHSIPDGCHADVKLLIDDYQGYDPNFVKNAIIDTAMDRQYAGSQQYKSISIKSGIIALAGVFWIVLAFAGTRYSWWGDTESIVHNVISGILSIFATVFGWEAVNTIVIHQNQFVKDFRHLISKMRYLIILDNDGNAARERLTDIGPFSHYRARAASEWLLMLSCLIFFAVVMLRLIRYFSAFVLIHITISNYELVLTPIMLSILLVLAIFGVLIYKGRLRLLLPSAIINVSLVAISITNMVLVFVHNEPTQSIVSAFFILIGTIIFTIGLAIKFHLFKKHDLYY